MFIEDLKNDFYNVLLGNRVLLLVHYDVDAVCACKILQGLFKTDNISYTLVPVGGVSELKKAYEENNEEVKYVVLVNCGGTIDLVDILQPEEDVIFFVLDYHKPTDVCNVYSDGQVRLVYKDTEENIPNFDDIFRDDEDEEEESVGREGAEAVVERRRARRDWEERRNTLMFNYTQFSYYGKPSAVVLVQLARLLSRVEVQTSWCGCVSVATAEESCRRAPAAALLDASELQPLATHPPYSVTVAKTLALPLLTDWSLWSALRHSPRLAPSLRLHRRAGEQRLRALLADMGVPLAQARQAYRAMDVELRAALLQRTEDACGKAALPTPAKAVAVLRRAHASPRSALDAGYALAALLAERQLGAALRALDARDDAAARAAAAAARRAIEAAVNAVTRALAAKAVTLAGPFAFLALSEPMAVEWARLAARWAGAALGGRRAVLLAAPAPRPAAHTLLLGVPPDPTQEPRNLFGAAFEQAAAKSGVSVSLEHFDPSAVTLPTAQRQAFVDALTALLS